MTSAGRFMAAAAGKIVENIRIFEKFLRGEALSNEINHGWTPMNADSIQREEF